MPVGTVVFIHSKKNKPIDLLRDTFDDFMETLALSMAFDMVCDEIGNAIAAK